MDIGVRPFGRWASLGTIGALAFLGLILFTIAAIIIMALIPLYLSTKSVTRPAVYSSGPETVTLPIQDDGTLNPGDTLSASGRAATANQLKSAFSKNPKVGNNVAVNVLSATVAQSIGKRKRRQNNRKLELIIVFTIQLPSDVCKSASCLVQILDQIRKMLLSIDITITIPVETQTSSSSTLQPTTTVTAIPTTTSSITTPSTTQITTTTTTTPVVDNTTVDDITIISQYWSRLSPYSDNAEDAFGVEDTGLPDGCQVEQAHVLHRNGESLPSIDEFQLMSTFTSQVTAAQKTFTGPLSYLNTWSLQLSIGGLLAEGVHTEFASGTYFWVNYGRLLYNAVPGQPFYNSTGQVKPVLRSPDTEYLAESAEIWAKGFFYILNSPESDYTLVTIPASSGNNTLASFVSCPNYENSSYGLNTFQDIYIDLLPTFLQSAVTRLSAYAPSYTNFSATDVFTLQLLCVYEYHAFYDSDACSLFTIAEWQGFEYILDILGYYGYSFGQPAGRALGLGYLEELLARLNQEYVTATDSSVNITLDSSAATFPLNQTFYMDMTHGSTIVSFLTALSLDYFREPLSKTSLGSNDRTFKLGEITPFTGHLITEKIGCNQFNPAESNSSKTLYTATQYGYSSASAGNKFVRMRLNNGILPLSTIRGGFCAGRTDGLCPLSNFLTSQNNATAFANYQYVCFGSYSFNQTLFNGDGSYFATM